MGKLRLERKVASKVWLQVGAEEPGVRGSLSLVPHPPPKKNRHPSIFRSLVCMGAAPGEALLSVLSQPTAAKVPTHWLPANYSFLQIKGLVY